MNAAMSQHKALSRFSRRHMGAGGAQRNVSALVLNIRDDGPAFARGASAGAVQAPAAIAEIALPGALALPDTLPARTAKNSGWKAVCLCCLLFGCALAWYAWTLRQDLVLLETTLSALAEDSAQEDFLLRLNPELPR